MTACRPARGQLVRISLALMALAVAGCGLATGPAGQPSVTDVNPITKSRGGSGSAN